MTGNSHLVSAEHNAWVARVLGVQVGAAPPSIPAGADTVDHSTDALTAELLALERRIPAAVQADPAAKERLIALSAGAKAALETKDLTRSAEQIGLLRAALDGGSRPGTAPADDRVSLDAEPAPTPGRTNGGWAEAHQTWIDANDSVNDDLNALRAAVLSRAKEDPEYAVHLADIADKGLNAVTGNHRAKLTASLLDIGDGSPAALAANGAKTLALVTAFQAFIDASDEIRVCDANPFGVPVSIKATLVPALGRLADALRSTA